MRGVWVAVGLLSLSCYRTTITTATVETRVSEQRAPTNTAAPRLQVVWQFQPAAVVGQLQQQQCKTDRAWVDAQVRTTQRRPQRWIPIAAFSLTTATSAVAAATYDPKPTMHCDYAIMFPASTPPRPPCQWSEPDNTLPKALFVSSAVFLAIGVVSSLQSGDGRVEVLSETPRSTSVLDQCLTRGDLDELVLAVRGQSGQLWPAQLSNDGRVAIALPQTPALPRDEDLKLVVYRAPRSKLAGLVRGQVLSTFQLPAPEAPAATAPPAPPPSEPSQGAFPP